MAEINILTASSIKGMTVSIRSPSNPEGIVILSNPSSSGKLLKVNALSVYFNGTGHTGYIFVNGVIFDKISDTGSRYKVINKNESIYLQEGSSIAYRLATGSGLDIMFTVSYEEIS